MAYKRYFYRNGKKFGPYYYESYRDENGDVKKRYIGTENPDKKKISVGKLVLGGLVLLAVVAVVFVSVQMSGERNFSFGGNELNKVGGFVSNSLLRIVGLVVDDEESQPSVVDDSASADDSTASESSDLVESEESEVVAPQEEAPAEVVDEEDVLLEEEPEVVDAGLIGGAEEIVDDGEENVSGEVEEVVEVFDENVSEIIDEELNVSEGGNESVVEGNESVVVDEELNESGMNISEIIDIELNESVIGWNVTGEGNESGMNVSVKQYKAVIERRVKWIKKIVVNESGNVNVEIPLSAENVTIKTGNEINEAEAEIDEYNNLVDEVGRGDIADGTITGFVAKDIRNGRGIFTRLWIWIKGFTISGNVIDEVELELSGDIVETNDSKIVNLDDIVDEELTKGDEAKVAIEYYTKAPTAEEINISRGKKVVVSADDDLNYTDILAYSILDNRVGVNSSRLKVYHLVPIIQDESEVQSPVLEDVGENETEKDENKNESEVVEDVNESIEINITEIVNESVELNESVEVVEKVKEEKNKSEVVEKVKEEKNKSEEKKGGVVEKVKEEKNKSEEKNIKKVNGDGGKGKKEKDGEGNLSLAGISGNVVLDVGDNVSIEESKPQITQIDADFVVREEVEFDVYDLDGDGFVDYVEWVVPHLSNQTYEIIYIGGAEHLDSNRTFVEDVYENVSVLGDNKSAVIPDGDYLRVVFEKNLTREKDITIYARAKIEESENRSQASGNVSVYREGGDERIALFENITNLGEFEMYKIYLTNLGENESLDTFDLRSFGDVEYDYVVDPTIIISDVTTGDLVNVTKETGVSNHTHLNISNTAPYDSLVGYWSFDGDLENTALTTAYDWSGEGNDGTYAGNVVANSTGGKYGEGLVLDGTGDYVDLGDVDEFSFTDGAGNDKPFTVSAWMYTPLSTPVGTIVSKRWASGGYYEWDFFFSGNNLYVGLYHYDDSAHIGRYVNAASGSPFSNAWKHVVMTYDGSEAISGIKIYRDGVRVDTSNYTTGSYTGMTDRNKSALIGASSNSALGNTANFNGSIDDVMIFNTSLTADQILEIYNNQSARYLPTGTQGFGDQSVLNVSAGYDKVWVTGDYEANMGSGLNLSVGYYDGSWHQTAEQVFNGSNLFTTNKQTTNLTLNFSFLAGNSTNPFYSPILMSNVNALVVNMTDNPVIEFVEPTPDSGATWGSSVVPVNVSVSSLSSNVSGFVDFDGSLVGWWRMDDVNTTGEGALVEDISGHCYDNETEILTENGWKYFYDLSENEKVMTLNNETGEKEWQTFYENQEFENNKEMYKIELEDGSNLLVSEKHKVYASLNNFSISSSDNTLIDSCSFNPGSLDQIGDLSKYNDNANNGKSLMWGDNLLASGINDLYSDLGINLTTFLINKSKNSNSELESPEDFIICFFKPLISKNTKSGETSLYPICFNSLVSRNTLDLLKKENKMFVSNISNIFYSCNLATLSFTHSENSFASLSESLDLEAMFSPISNNISSSISSCRTLSIALLTNFSNCKFLEIDNISLSNSSGMLIQTSAISEFNKEDYKNLLVMDYMLQPVIETYEEINNGKEVYFLDSENKPIKVKSITKEKYNGKIYDVDVENDIVLVRRKNSSAIWSGNSNNGTAVGNAVQIDNGKLGKGFSFDGDGDYIAIPYIDFLNLNTSFTYVMWVKMAATTSSYYYLVSPTFNGYTNAFFIYNNLLTYDNYPPAGFNVQSSSSLSANVWYHVGVTRLGTNVTLYINGQANKTGTGNTPPGDTNQGYTYIGSLGAGGNSCNGSIDDVMIFNRSLSAAEIRGLYANSSSKYFSNNFTSLADGLHTFRAYVQDEGGSVVNTSLRSVTVATGVPTVAFGADVLANGTQTANDWIWMNVSVADVALNVSAFVDKDNSLVSWWRMDDLNASGGVVDYMGRNNGSVVGNASQTDAGKLGKAFEFDGDGDYVIVTDTGTNVEVDYVTITAWIYPRSFSQIQNIVSRGNNAYRLWISDSGKLGCYLRNGTNTQLIDASTISVQLNTWNFVALTYNGTNISFYNSTSKDVPTTTISNFLAKDADYPLYIGTYSSSSQFINGTLDDVMIFNRSLSADEVLGLYANTSSKYVTENHTGVANGWHTFKPYVQNLAGSVVTLDARTLGVDTIYPLIEYSTGTEGDYANKSQNWIYVNVSVSDVNYANITFNLYNNSVELNSTTYLMADGLSNTSINWTGLGDSNLYTYWVNISDAAGNKNSTSVRHITLDVSPPVIIIVYPDNGTSHYSSLIDFNVSV
ncbi:MAG: LamG-like jellyroll fold domain-containing protein, partial [archaeon]